MVMRLILPDMQLTKRAENITGRRSGKLTAIKQVGVDKYRTALWEFSCDCGGSVVARGSSFRRREIRSCSKSCALTRYGTTLVGKNWMEQRLIKTWHNMIQRCHNPKDIHYRYYGARGIKVCDRWRFSYMNFRADVIDIYDPYLTIDRINNAGNYEPGNVRWVSMSMQNLNRRTLYDAAYLT